MSLTNVFAVSADLSAAVLSLILSIILAFQRKRTKLDRDVQRLILVCTFLIANDALTYAFDGASGRIGFYLIRLSNYLLFLGGYMMLISFGRIVYDYARMESSLELGLHRLVIVLSVASMLLATGSQFGNWIYYIDAQNVYHRTALFPLSQIVAVVGAACYLYILISNRRKILKSEFYALCAYIIFLVIATIAQVFVYGFPIQNLSIVAAGWMLFCVREVDIRNQLKTALDDEKRSRETVDAIAKLYWLIYRLDLRAGTYEEIFAHEETQLFTGEKGLIRDIYDEVCEKIAADEYKPMMVEFWDLSTLPQRLRDVDHVSVEYKTANGFWNLARFIVNKREEDGTVTGVLYVVHRNDAQKKQELEYQRELLAAAEEMKRTNKKLQETAAKAESANAAKSNFLSRMSHDIRTPLNGIIGLLKIDMAHFDDQALVMENHKKMQTAANHLLSLINDVLQMSKLEDGNFVLTREVVSLVSLTQDIVNIIIGRAVEAGIEWDYEKGKSVIPYPYIYGSPVHLRQIFLNIYGNCIKYNRPGGKITTIVDTLEEKDGFCTYRWTITDTGVGMSQEFISHIFEPFVQERADARSVYHGTGLGMTIVKGLVEKMNGTITVTSQLGVGSTFVVAIPFEIAQPPQETAAVQTGTADIHGLRLLLVEDNELNAEIAQTLLEDEGAQITLAVNGREAVERFAAEPPGSFDAILMDIMMPVMDGLSASRAIRAMERPDAAAIPILAMTANAFEEDAQKCFAAGMNAHLSKPLRISEVVSEIARLCRR